VTPPRHPPEQTDEAPERGSRAALFALGFVTLFLELVLIRYLAGSIWNLGYFPNLVLLAVFLGMGLGFLLHDGIPARRSPALLLAAMPALAGLVALVALARPVVPGFSKWMGSIGGEIFFTAAPTAATESSTWLFALWFGAVVGLFLLIAQRAAKLFRQHAPLTAYTLDIAGSCAGILAFMGVSFARLPAWSWFPLLVPAVVVAAGPRRWRASATVAGLCLAAAAFLARSQDVTLMSDPAIRPQSVAWSPYQKVEYADAPGLGQRIFVNGVSHQVISGSAALADSFYAVPHLRRSAAGAPPYGRVLVIGAGAGNDVAAALAHGAREVDAVEIDPVIAGLGRAFHPAKPYSDPRVRLIVDDARAFMTRARPGYDLIVFALTDSLVKVSAQSQLRLENFLFTRESVARAWSLLAPDGDLLFYNFYRAPWLIGKLTATLREATGRVPLEIYARRDFHMLRVGRSEPPATEELPALARASVPTDDWPFPYLRSRRVPRLYVHAALALAGLLVLLALLTWGRTRRRARRSGDLAVSLAFLAMGLAFLLLESKSVVQFSLLFGTTWLNSSLVFLGVLVSVLAANWTATLWRGRRALAWIFPFLIGSCLVPLAFPLSRLLAVESPELRFAAAVILTFSPIFLANLTFSVAFREQAAPEHVFGWNLLGATLGGVSEYASLAVGYNALALVVAAAYVCAFACLWLSRRQAAAA
jgi:spermidine synthase